MSTPTNSLAPKTTQQRPASNPFGQQAGNNITPARGATVSIDQQRAIAEVQAAIMIARANPRDPIMAMDRILNACTRTGLAESSVYTYARGGSEITGPSIRLAEVLAQNWGNIQYGIREISQDSGESTVQAYAWDVETNTRREITFQIPHIRHTRNGPYPLTDPRDVYELVANNGARRVRACILGVIPPDVVEEAIKQCEMTLKTSADTSAENIKRMLDLFAEYGVTKAQIEVRIQRRIETIAPAQMISLRKIAVSLKDGMSKPEDWFEQTGTEEPKKTTSPKEPAETPENPQTETAPAASAAQKAFFAGQQQPQA